MKHKSVGSGWWLSALLVVAIVIGVGLLLYPTVSDYVNAKNQSKAVVEYVDALSSISDEQHQKMWAAADEYNKKILQRENVFVLSDDERQEYEDLLSLGNDKVIGYVEVPAAKVLLPIFHGTGASALRRGAGHLEWTSLPVGGVGTHAVISSHRGLPSALLFTHLDQVVVGDVFMLYVLNEVLTYEVDQIMIVEPIDTKDLLIDRNTDYCTLFTCTPYGVNSHRLLVRGHRIANAKEVSVRVVSEAMQVSKTIVSLALAFPLLLLLLIFVAVSDVRRAKARKTRTAISRVELQDMLDQMKQ